MNSEQRKNVRVDGRGSSQSTSDNAISLDGLRPTTHQKDQQSYWPFLILFGSLLISIGNTLLLSFVFKSMRTSDELSNFDGKISWDEASSSNLLQIPIELQESAKLKLNSLERVNSEIPLELLVRFEQSLDELGSSPMQVKFIENQPINGDEMVNFNNINYQDDNNRKLVVDNANNKFASFFALNLNATHDELMSSEDKLRKTLELGTRMLLINKINNNKQANGHFDHANKGQNTINLGDNKMKETPSISRLLELDTLEASVTLPMQKQLTTTTTSTDDKQQAQIKLDEKLICPHLHGSIESNLELQARGADLVCRANDAIIAQSKSGDAKLSFYENIHLEAPEIELNGRDIFIPKGLDYLESALPTDNQFQIEQNNDNAKQQLGAKYEALELISINDQLATANSNE